MERTREMLREMNEAAGHLLRDAGLPPETVRYREREFESGFRGFWERESGSETRTFWVTPVCDPVAPGWSHLLFLGIGDSADPAREIEGRFGGSFGYAREMFRLWMVEWRPWDDLPRALPGEEGG